MLQHIQEEDRTNFKSLEVWNTWGDRVVDILKCKVTESTYCYPLVRIGLDYLCFWFVLFRRRSVFNRCVDRPSSSVNGSEAAREEEEAAEADIGQERCSRDILMASRRQRVYYGQTWRLKKVSK